MKLGDRPTARVDVALDAGLGVIFAIALVGHAAAIAASWGDTSWQFGFGTGAAASAVAFVRRRHLTLAASAGLAIAATAMLVARVADLPAEPGPATALALSVLVGSAIRKLPTRPAGVVTGAGFVLVAASWVAFPSASSAIPNVTVLNGAAWLAAIAAGLGLRLLDTRRQATIDVIRRDERLELARELHDVVAHHITGIVLQSQAAQLVAHTQSRTTLADSFAGIEVSGSEALAAMRRVVGLLRDADDAAPTTSVPEQLEDLVNRFSSHGPKVHLHAPDGEPPWTPELTSTVYRIVQESLTNVARHAPDASSVAVSITHDHQTITVKVVDDAPSVTARHHHRDGFGLIGMRERVEALGGSLQAGPRAETGWSVLANLPVPPPEAR